MEIELSNAEEKLKEIKDTDLTQLDDFALSSMKTQMEDCLKDPSATFHPGQYKAAMFICMGITPIVAILIAVIATIFSDESLVAVVLVPVTGICGFVGVAALGQNVKKAQKYTDELKNICAYKLFEIKKEIATRNIEPSASIEEKASVCSKCGYAFEGDDTFCPKCGTKRKTL